MRDKLHAEDIFGVILCVGEIACNLYSAAFAAPSGVNLSLDNDACGSVGQQGSRSFDCFRQRIRYLASRYGDAVLGQDCLCLILVYLHKC